MAMSDKVDSATLTQDKFKTVTLYSGASTTAYNNSVTFNQNPQGFTYIEFYGTEVGGRSVYCKIANTALGDKAILAASVSGNGGVSNIFIRSTTYELTSTGAKCVATGQLGIATDGTITQNTNAAIKLIKVIGYR